MFFESSELIKCLKYNIFNEFLKLGIRILTTKFNYLTKYAYKDNNLELRLFNEKIPD